MSYKASYSILKCVVTRLQTKVINELQIFNRLNYRRYLHKCNIKFLGFCFRIEPIITLAF